MASKETETLESKGTIKLKSGEDFKARMLKRLSSESTKQTLITRTGLSINGKAEENIGLSNQERQRRAKAFQNASETTREVFQKFEIKKQPEPIKERIEEEVVVISDESALQIKPKSSAEFKPSLSVENFTKTAKKKPEVKKEVKVPEEEVEAPKIIFKTGEAEPYEEPLAKETKVKATNRDMVIINNMMEHFQYIEFDNAHEIESLQKGLQLRVALEERRKAAFAQTQAEDFNIQVAGSEAEEDVIKIRREAYFSRHNKKPAKRRHISTSFVAKEVEIYDRNLILDIARGLGIKVEDFTRKLRHFGINVKENDIIDGDAAELAIEEMGHIVKRIKKITAEDKINKHINSENLKSIAPVVTIMGHVNHGKTSLLDALRNKNIAESEVGGITQHIGAYQTVLENGSKITFIDTPGHEAFTAIRARGANITHVIVIVVAADDGIMPQTVEAINHAKAAGVPIVVAINKIDSPGADIQKVKNQFLIHEIVSEDLGGDVIFVPISAKKRENLDKLCEAILLQAETLNIMAEYGIQASGTVLEGKLDKQKGIVGNLLVQNGTLKIGDIVIIENSYFKIRSMSNDSGESIVTAEPSVPLQVYGLSEVPRPGANFNVVESEKIAKEITSHRKDKKIEAEKKNDVKAAFGGLFKPKEQKKSLTLIIRADVQSTIEAIRYSLDAIKMPSEVEIKIMQASVGPVTEADITFAKTYNAVIFAFSVKVGTKEEELAKRNSIILKQHAIIYNIVGDVKEMLSEKLSPIVKDEIIGEVEVRAIFDISKSGKIAGCMVRKGSVKRNAIVKVFRKDALLIEGKLKTLKHFKEDVKEISAGNECGIQIEGFENFLAGDTMQIVERTEEKRTIA